MIIDSIKTKMVEKNAERIMRIMESLEGGEVFFPRLNFKGLDSENFFERLRES